MLFYRNVTRAAGGMQAANGPMKKLFGKNSFVSNARFW
jgi:hypothetical protein